MTSTISGLLSSACATTMRRKPCTPGSGLRVMTTFHGFYSNMFAATNMFVRDNYLCFSGSKRIKMRSQSHTPSLEDQKPEGKFLKAQNDSMCSGPYHCMIGDLQVHPPKLLGSSATLWPTLGSPAANKSTILGLLCLPWWSLHYSTSLCWRTGGVWFQAIGILHQVDRIYREGIINS